MSEIHISYDAGPEFALDVVCGLLREFGVNFTQEDGDGWIKIMYEKEEPRRG